MYLEQQNADFILNFHSYVKIGTSCSHSEYKSELQQQKKEEGRVLIIGGPTEYWSGTLPPHPAPKVPFQGLMNHVP